MIVDTLPPTGSRLDDVPILARTLKPTYYNEQSIELGVIAHLHGHQERISAASYPGFNCRERLFDWIEFRRIGREKTQSAPDSFNNLSQHRTFMDCAIVYDEDTVVLWISIHLW